MEPSRKRFTARDFHLRRSRVVRMYHKQRGGTRLGVATEQHGSEGRSWPRIALVCEDSMKRVPVLPKIGCERWR